MHALANQPLAAERGRVQPAATLRAAPPAAPVLQRKASCACGGGCQRCQSKLPVQTKLAVSRPGDQYEQEADRVAEQVMRTPDATIQRTCAGCSNSAAECPGCKSEGEGLIQRKTERVSDDSGTVPGDVLNSLGPGQPLDPVTRAFFEPRFGYDFGRVRVHTDDTADESARSVGALAYTLGPHVVFARGRHAPSTSSGRKLLAHELAHVTQQAEGRVQPCIQRTITVDNPTTVTPPHTRTNGAVVVSLFDELCPATSWQIVDGEITPVTADFCAAAAGRSATRVSCDCACQFTSAAGPHVSIEINQTADDTQFTSGGAANSFSMRLRGLADPDIRGVTGAPVAPGENSLRPLADPPWLILGHELCGHAMTTLPNVSTPGRPISVSHESTAGWGQSAVDIENRIRREHSARLGTDLGTRAGDFMDVEGHIHFGAIVQLPAAMTLMTLMAALGVPTGSHRPRCPVPDWYNLCGSTAPIASIPILNRVAYRTGGNFNVAERCLTRSFAAGDFFAIEGVFWHLADGTETKAAIAARWGVTVAALDRANNLFNPAIAALAPADAVPAGISVIIPYRLAPGTTRFFFNPTTEPC